MTTDAEQMLDDASQGIKIDYSQWSEILQWMFPILDQVGRTLPKDFKFSFRSPLLDQIVYHGFPMPRIAVPGPSPPVSSRNGEEAGASTPTRSPKTTIIPATPQPPANTSGAEKSTTPPDPSSPSVVPNSQPPAGSGAEANPALSTQQSGGNSSVSNPQGSLPPPLLTLYSQIQASLRGPFGALPPYTLQRLAELVLRPRAHYQTLPAYLRALDRVLSVSSTADVYPLPLPPENQLSGGVLGGEQSNGVGATVRRDDAGFNGAELTRIPWIRDSAENSSIGSSEDADAASENLGGGTSAAAVDSPERMLLNDAEPERLSSPGATVDGGGGGGVQERQDSAAPPDEVVHARGPQEISNEDIGPQRAEGGGMPGIVDLEAAVGRPGEGEVVPGSAAQVPEERRAQGEASRPERTSEAGNEGEMAIDEVEKKQDDETAAAASST